VALPPIAEWTVDPDPLVAETLPASAFTSQEWLDAELDTVFRGSWVFVPERAAADLRDDPRSMADLVRRRGSRAPVSLLDRPFFLQRDWDGRLHLFPNVCTDVWRAFP
jgi:phenylpropionate dioxygenase-like ring-hydroxylating dioxygenase large terminal subunit